MDDSFKRNIEYVFNNFFSEEEIEQVLSDINGLSHPIFDIVNPYCYDSSNNNGFTRENVRLAFNIIIKKNSEWLNKIKKRLINNTDYSQPSSALGELRCYGYLLEAFTGYDVKPTDKSSTPTPDFSIINENEIVEVEVNTPQMNGEEQKALEQFNNQQNSTTHNKPCIREHVTAPFGRKNAKCVTENVIHKITSIKEDEAQFSKKTCSILWVDLQDSHMNSIDDRCRSSCPIFTGRGYSSMEDYFSNELWYATYASKGTPIFESVNLGEGIPVKELPKVTYDGRFCKKRKSIVDAIIFSLPHNTVIYENPYAKHKIPKWFIEAIQNVRWYSYQGSKLNFPDHILRNQLRIDRKIITSLSQKELKHW